MEFRKDRLLIQISEFYTRNLKATMSAQAKAGITALLSFIETDIRWTDVNAVAYFLATIGHETAWTFQPIKEIRASERNTKIKKLQDRYWYTGYYGRGYVQITWEDNYKKFSKLLNIDLVKYPDRALEYSVAYNIASTGMLYGIFTGKKISDYIKNGKVDFINARRVINGTDRAQDIASIATIFVRILKQNRIEKSAIKMTPDKIDTNEIIQAPESEVKASVAIGDSKYESPMPIFKHEPEKVKSFKQTIAGLVTSLGVSASALYGKIYNFVSDPKVYWAALIIVVLILICLVINYFINKMINERREARAHELTLEELRITANPHLQNVVVDKDKYII